MYLNRHGGHIPAGFLSVVQEGNETVARVFCDEDQGFLPVFDNFTEMR